MAIGQASLSSIGMSVPGASGNWGGADLQNQRDNESDEERRRRLEAERQARLMGGGPGAAALGSIYGGNVAAGAIGGMSMGRFGL
jgi:hypothetical protein